MILKYKVIKEKVQESIDVSHTYEGVRDIELDKLLKELNDAITEPKK